MAGVAAAGQDAFYAAWDGGHVIVDRGAQLEPALASQLQARPVPFSHGKTAQVATIGNIRIERNIEAACGTRTPDRLVLCLDADGKFPASDELILLARAAKANSIQVGSVKARSALTAALSDADITSPVPPVITAFADCRGQCDGRVVIGSAP